MRGASAWTIHLDFPEGTMTEAVLTKIDLGTPNTGHPIIE